MERKSILGGFEQAAKFYILRESAAPVKSVIYKVCFFLYWCNFSLYKKVKTKF